MAYRKDRDPKFKTLELNGVAIDVFVDDNGTFRADFDGQRYVAGTFANLTEKLKKAVTTKGRVEVLATLLDRRDARIEFERITLTGIHRGTGKAIYRGPDDRVSQIRYERVYRRLTDEEERELAALQKALYTLEHKIEAWLEERELDEIAAVKAAQAAALVPVADGMEATS